MGALENIPIRRPTSSELDFFQSRKDVAGMATSDHAVILNPLARLDKDPEKNRQKQQQVVLNERIRVFLRKNELDPQFDLTDEQKKNFQNYSQNPVDVRHTILSRIISGDTSAGKITNEQRILSKKIQAFIALSH